MLFVSNAAWVLEKKAKLAAQRMFLFSDDVVVPDRYDSVQTVVGKINAARGFCAKLNADLSMSCVRSAGWKNNRLYYNFVPSVLPTDTSISRAQASKTVTVFDMFSRYYSMGRSNPGTYYDGTGSVLETLDHAVPRAPLDHVMSMPAFDGTQVSQLSTPLRSLPDSLPTLSTSSSGSSQTSLGIVTSRWTTTTTTMLNYTEITQLNFTADTAYIFKTGSDISNGGVYTTSAGSLGPRLFAPSTWVYTVSKSPYSETVTGTTSNYSYGPLNSTTAVKDENYLFGIASSKPDTADYSLTWGMMPIAGDKPDVPLYAIVLRAGTDFDQTGLTTPGVKPVMQMREGTALSMDKKYIV